MRERLLDLLSGQFNDQYHVALLDFLAPLLLVSHVDASDAAIFKFAYLVAPDQK